MFSLLFIDTERVWRGGQDQLFTLMKGLHERGHAIHLICHPQTLLQERAAEIGIMVHPMTIRSEIGPIALFRLISSLCRIHPEVLAFNTPKAILIGTLASRIVPVDARIVFRRVSFPLRKSFITRFKYTWGIDCIIAISESIRLQLASDGINASRIRTIYEGIDPSLYPSQTDRKIRRPRDPIVVGTVANLSREKGLHYLIEAARLIPNVHERLQFIIVGEGECLQELRELVREKRLENVFQFAGFHASTYHHMKEFDIFALPSLSEGLSSAILEAMAASLPIVATEVGGIPELVKSGDNGLLIAPADPVSLARAIRYLADNPEESERMGRRGRKRIEEQFTLERKIAETEKLCAALLKRPVSYEDCHYRDARNPRKLRRI
jgi:glycosyltransferase involved in cell wall biosynthesis